MSSRFDALTKDLANGMDRRHAMRTMGGILGAGVLAYLGIGCAPDTDPVGPDVLTNHGTGPVKPRTALSAMAAAAATCSCDGASFDPASQCCTSAGAVQKYPIQDLASCPNRVATTNPGYTGNTQGNGCGTVARQFPKRFGKANILSACNTHDICYGTCNSDRVACDQAFQANLFAACDAGYAGTKQLESCKTLAVFYFVAVVSEGIPAYEDAQKLACDCCGADTSSCPGDGTCCGSSCMEEGQQCCGGVTLCDAGPVGQCCGTDCCGSDEICTRNGCCPQGSNVCSGGCCAPPFTVCCESQSFCCPTGTICVPGGCAFA